MINRSRYGKYSSRSLPKQKKRLEQAAKGTDRGRYFYCWNCGAINDSQRQTEHAHAKLGTETVVELGEPITGDSNSIHLCADSIGFNYQVIPEVAPDGNPRNPHGGFQTNVTSGCWFCGCSTWRG